MFEVNVKNVTEEKGRERKGRREWDQLGFGVLIEEKMVMCGSEGKSDGNQVCMHSSQNKCFNSTGPCPE